MEILHDLKEHMLNIIYPDDISCIACDADLELDTHYRYGLCQSCVEEVEWITGRTCRKCGGPNPVENSSEVCVNCEKRVSYLDRCEACFGYSGAGIDLIMALKYNRKTYLGKYLATMMADVVVNCYGDDIDLIVSVPLHRKRKAARGFNQMTMIGEPLADILQVPYTEQALVRTKNSPRLKNLDRHERKLAVENLFKAQKELVLGKRILLIDDIFTTGATMNACAKALHEAGALNVYGAVLAVNYAMDE